MPPVLTHFAFVVRDLDASTAFYARYCGMRNVHDRSSPHTGERTVWLAQPGRERELIFVLMHGDTRPPQRADDYSHFGFAVESRTDVDAVAERAQAEGCLVWPPRDDAYPVGYHCGVRDPDGNFVEFSYGQPLGPGAPTDLDP